jgi:hypothetical protein
MHFCGGEMWSGFGIFKQDVEFIYSNRLAGDKKINQGAF